MKYRLVKGAVPLRDHLGEVTFEAQGDDTLVTWRCQFNSSIPGLGGLLRRMITRLFASVLERLGAQLAR
jgi:carbon monoxide dehydrogenase subunit G